MVKDRAGLGKRAVSHTRVGIEVVVLIKPSVEQALLEAQFFVKAIVVADAPTLMQVRSTSAVGRSRYEIEKELHRQKPGMV